MRMSPNAPGRTTEIELRSSGRMLDSATRACPIPSSPKASANGMNNSSRVLRQKRRKNRPQMTKPNATAPDRKSYRVTASLLPHFPHESPNQRCDRGQRQQEARQSQVEVRPHDEVQNQHQIVRGQ